MRINTLSENDDALTDEQVDRLVDGELSLAEQRALLEQIEASPNGWRRVGLAFLEAQSLRQSCTEWAVPIATIPVPSLSSTNMPVRQHRWLRLVTSAVVLMVAFTAGMVTGHPWPTTSAPSAVVADAPAKEEPAEQMLPAEPITAIPVAFQFGDGALSEPVTTPVVDVTSPEGQAWLRSTPGVPERVREQLRRQGQKLQERQEWVEVDLADGRTGYLPVKEWTVSPVSLADFR